MPSDSFLSHCFSLPEKGGKSGRGLPLPGTQGKRTMLMVIAALPQFPHFIFFLFYFFIFVSIISFFEQIEKQIKTQHIM